MATDTPGNDSPNNILTRIGVAIIATIAVLAPVTLLGEFTVRHATFSRVFHGICICSHVTTLGCIVYLWRYLDESDRSQWRKKYHTLCLTLAILLALSTVSIFVPLNQLPLFCVLLFQGLAAITSGIVAAFEAAFCAINQRRWRISRLMQRGKYQAALNLLKPIVAGTKFDARDILNAANCYLKLGAISEGNKLIEQALALPGRTVFTSNIAACAYMEQHRYPEAFAILDSVSENETDLTLWNKCVCLNAMNRKEESRAAWQRLKASSNDGFLQSLSKNPDCQRVIESIEWYG